MASKGEDKPEAAKGDPAPEKKKRPARTIDLKAEEVEAADDETGKPGEDAGSPEAGRDAETAAGHDDKDSEKGTAGTEQAAYDSDGKPPPPPQRTQPSDLRAFATHLAAGLVGGLVGVVGAGVGLDKLPIAGLMGAGDTGQKTAQIEERLDELSGRVEQQSKTVSGAPSSSQIDDLARRLTVLEGKPAPEAPKLPDNLGERLAGLESTLKTLQEAGGKTGASGVEQAAALVARVDKAEQAFRERMAALSGELGEIRTLAEKAGETARSRPGDAALESVTARLDALDRKLADIAERPAATGTAQGHDAMLALAFESLRRAASGGEPFAAQLEAVSRLADGAAEAEALSASANRGVPARKTLLEALPERISRARSALDHAGDETFLDRLAANARSVVRIRRIGPAEGDSPQAVLSRVEALAAKGNLEAAAGEAGTLSGTAGDAMAPWLEQARSRLALDAALDALEKRLLARAAGAAAKEG